MRAAALFVIAGFGMTDSDRRLQQLRERYACGLALKRSALARMWRAFAAAPDSAAAARRNLHMHLHRLRGSALAYGYAPLSDRARSADELLRQWSALPLALRDSPQQLVAHLQAPMQAVLDELERAAADVPIAQRARERGDPLRLLLVDDDPAQAHLTSAELQAHGCTVRVETDTHRLWQTLVQWPCDAVVLDYWLRGETADEVAAMLRREASFARTALVCFSVEREAGVLRAALAAGCDAAIAKAEGSERLLDVVRECIARRDAA